ncbi:hypothetical protein MKW92_030085 [Papaver armeniacum]|nr:hypothetical protein MKW92_030085 [Papaver armeniacum]
MKKSKKNLDVMDNQTPISSEEVRNWLELPPNVLSLIFLKLGAIDILLRAQLVCSVWRKASKKPSLFRSIDIRNSWDLFEEQCDMMIGRVSFNGNMYDMQKMVREAVDRSCGQLVDFSLESFCCNELLAYTAEKSSSLRCLRLVYCYQVSYDTLINMAKKAAMLEELEICHCSFSVDTLKAVGNACHQLKSFRLNSRGYDHPGKECDDVALAIAENMPRLRHLHLFGNKMTNVGFKAILDGCLHLESLDVRQCFNLNLEGDLLKSCSDRLVKLRLPNDSTDDYEFDGALVYGYDDYGSEDGVIDILLRAQFVCSVWRKASKEPLLFRSIDTRNWWGLLDDDMYDMQKIVREAVDRSCGQLVDFSMARFGSNELLAYIADKSGSLRCLRLVFCYRVRCDALINMAKKAVLLEELDICYCTFSGDKLDMLKTVGKGCPQLKSFRLNYRGYMGPDRVCDDEALAIAQNMPQLHHLHLFGNKLTNVGLKAILDGCLHLESLDLRQCFNVNLEGDLLKSCGDRLIKVKLPMTPLMTMNLMIHLMMAMTT